MIQRNINENLDEYLIRLGDMKKTDKSVTWNDISKVMNEESGLQKSQTYWRKKYYKYDHAFSQFVPSIVEDEITSEETLNDYIDIELGKIKLRDERNALNRVLRSTARHEDIIEKIGDYIKSAEAPVFTYHESESETSIVAMLSDIHYGLVFDSFNDTYDTEIAAQRLEKYCCKIIDIAKQTNSNKVYLCLMGDMISGNIHNSIRCENREDVISQVVNVSQLISAFIEQLALNDLYVDVYSVGGNHSRIMDNAEDALRTEKLDQLIPWYCKTKLCNYKNVKFVDNAYDPSFSVLDVYGKRYVAVHGDYDKNVNVSAGRIANAIGTRVDYLLAGHMHVFESRFDSMSVIRNGAVLGGGDEYTSKNRLFGPAVQTCMLCSNNGVEAIYPIKLN